VALVVTADNKVERRDQTANAVGNFWRVTEGLNAGDRLITEGAQKVKPGDVVRPAVINAATPAPTDGKAPTSNTPADQPAAPAQPACQPPAGLQPAEGAVSRFFIDRPIFAWVIAIIIMLAGVMSITALPIEQYPELAPHTGIDQRQLSGASAQPSKSRSRRSSNNR
jgi:hypothetical protein